VAEDCPYRAVYFIKGVKMALTWTQILEKGQRLSRDTTASTLEQLKEDCNQGYHQFNNELSRYWSRKQQFCDLAAAQQIYQVPVDCLRVIGVVIAVSSTYQIPVKEIRSEFEWRQITAYPYQSNWPAYYYMIGKDEISFWPTPSQAVTDGLRFYYQQDDIDLSVEDVTSTSLGATVTCNNGSATVLASSNAFSQEMIGLSFQITGATSNQWYEIVDVPVTDTLTLKSAFVGYSGTGMNFRIGQLPILPSSYHDAIVNYGLYQFFSGKGNEARATQHLTLFKNQVESAKEMYSSSGSGNVITSDDNFVNAFFLTPLPSST